MPPVGNKGDNNERMDAMGEGERDRIAGSAQAVQSEVLSAPPPVTPATSLRTPTWRSALA
jgi:hypothetical protein